VTLVAAGGQAPDHPVHLGVPETRYLKTAFLAVRD
jgi:23S rRNA G2069 N7-methylase RlmK/C1962 C5-methylase RlmI